MDRVANRGINEFHTFKFIVIARIELTFVIEHKAFEFTSSNRYWFTGFRLPKCVAFCHVDLFSVRGALQKRYYAKRFFSSVLRFSRLLDTRTGIRLFISSALLSHHLNSSRRLISSSSNLLRNT